MNALPDRPVRRFLRPAAAVLLAALLSACGGTRVVTGEPPYVRVSAIVLHENDIDIEFDVRNVNTEPLEVRAVRFELELDGELLARYDRGLEAGVVPSGNDIVTVTMEPDAAGVARLEALEAGEVASLAYALSGDVLVPQEGRLRFENTGHVYPVPGRPGHFR
jgi:hypothetical protein